MINKSLLELRENLDFNYNLVSIELDTSPQRLRYISSDIITDAIYKDAFDTFCDWLRKDNTTIVSFDDNTDMYEIGDDSLVIVYHENQTLRYIIFDIQDAKKIENIIFKADKQVL